MRWLVVAVVACAPPPPRVLSNRTAVGEVVNVPIAGNWQLYGGARLEADRLALDLCGGGVASARSHVTLAAGAWQLRAEHTNSDCMTGTELRATAGKQYLGSAVLWFMHGTAETRLVLTDRAVVALDIGAYGGKGCCGTTSVRAISFVRQ